MPSNVKIDAMKKHTQNTINEIQISFTTTTTTTNCNCSAQVSARTCLL